MRSDTITMEAEIKELEAGIAALRAKAAAFDWLAAQELSVEWVGSIKVLYVERQGEDAEFHAPTLLDAVQWATEAEGGR